MAKMTAAQIVDRLGITASTWSAYVTRGQAPKPTGFDPQTGLRVWDARKIEEWIAKRPGRGVGGGPKPKAKRKPTTGA